MRDDSPLVGTRGRPQCEVHASLCMVGSLPDLTFRLAGDRLEDYR